MPQEPCCAHEPTPTPTSRRRVLQAGAVLGAGWLGLASPLHAYALAPTLTLSDAAGADGRPPEPGVVVPRALAADPAGDTSYNGWPVGSPGSVIGVQNFTVPGTSIVLPIRSGDVATVLLYVARRFDSEVETLLSGQCWGYSYRANVNNPSVWSNHASGTAIDLNSAKHPNGAAATFTAAQTAAVRSILAFCGDVVYWGQDYRGVVDGMHFEIDVPPGDPRLSMLASRIRNGGANPIGSVDAATARPNSRVRVAGWAFDPDEPATSIPVAIYLSGVGIAWFPTDVARPDVNSVFRIKGTHGFVAEFDSPPGDQTVQVYGINVSGGTGNPLIGQVPVTVGIPIGYLDNVVAGPGTASIQGWAFDPDVPSKSIQVAVYRNGQGVGWFPANGSRPDVNAAFGLSGQHGFVIDVPSPPGSQKFDLYAINEGPPTGNPYIGSKTVNVW